MSVLSQRLRAARTALYPEITQKDVAKRLEKSPSAVNLWEAGKNEPSASDLAELASWYKVSTDWLLGVAAAEAPPAIRAGVANTAPALPVMHVVPVVPALSLSRWQWADPLELLQTSVAYPDRTAAAILVSSDVLQSTCPVGAYAVVSKAHTYDDGHIVLATTGRASEPVLRRLMRDGGEQLLIADDQRYPSFRMDDGVKIIGRVTEIVLRRMLA